MDTPRWPIRKPLDGEPSIRSIPACVLRRTVMSPDGQELANVKGPLRSTGGPDLEVIAADRMEASHARTVYVYEARCGSAHWSRAGNHRLMCHGYLWSRCRRVGGEAPIISVWVTSA